MPGSAYSRIAAPAKLVGIALVRTYQRWTEEAEVKVNGRRDALRPEPANKLSVEKRQQMLEVCHRPEFTSLPPGQIVPRLVDKGEYVASESSCYRILRAAGGQHHRGRRRPPRKVGHWNLVRLLSPKHRHWNSKSLEWIALPIADEPNGC
jgi:hypothetical protein